MLELSLTLATENKLSFKEVRKATNEHGLFYPNARWYEDAVLAQVRSTLTTTYTEELKTNIVVKLQAVHDYYEGLHSRIQSNLCPIEDYMDFHLPYLDITSLRRISRIQEKSHFPDLGIYLSPEDFPTELIHININSIQSKATNS